MSPTIDFQTVLARSFALLVRNAVPLLILAGLIVGLPSLLLRDTALDREVANPGIWEGLTLSGLVLMVAQALLHAAVTTGLMQQLAGQPAPKLGDLLAAAWATTLPVIGVSLVKGLALGLLFGIGSYWWLVLPLPFLVVGIWLGARWLVAVPAAVTEKLDVADALGRSRELTAGHRWTLMAWLAILWAVTLVAGKIIGALFGVLGLGGLAHAAVLIASAALDATAAVVIYWTLKSSPEQVTVQTFE